MTTPKNAPKKARRPRGEAERERREVSLAARELYSGYTNEALSTAVRDLAIEAPTISEHELLLVIADRLIAPPHFIGGAPMRFDPAKMGGIGGQTVGVPPGGITFNAGEPFTPPGAEGAS